MKQLCPLARGKLGIFEEGLDVEQEFAHGGDEGAFIRFAALAQALDVDAGEFVSGIPVTD